MAIEPVVNFDKTADTSGTPPVFSARRSTFADDVLANRDIVFEALNSLSEATKDIVSTAQLESAIDTVKVLLTDERLGEWRDAILVNLRAGVEERHNTLRKLSDALTAATLNSGGKEPFTLVTVDEPLSLGGKWEITSNVSFVDITTEEIADEKLSLPTILWNSSSSIAQAVAPKVNAVQSQIRLRDGTSSTAVVIEAGTIAGFVWDKKTDGGYELRDISPELTQEVKANTYGLKLLTDAAADAPKPAQYEWKRISTAGENIEFSLFPGLRFEMKSTDQQLRVRYTGGGTITLTEKISRHEQSGESYHYDGTFSISSSWKNFTNRDVNFTGAGAIENHYFRYGGRDYKVSGVVGDHWKNCVVDMLVSGG